MIAYPRIIAHRCGGALAPENRLEGLVRAAQFGCRGVEFDVMLTADQVPILMHDETLERTTALKGRVDEVTLAEIRAGDPGVPTLAEAVAECARLGLWANIELKPVAGHEEATGAVVGAWLAVHWNGRGVVSSFSEKSALAARRHLPDTAFALLCEALPADWPAAAQRLGAAAIHLEAAAVDSGVAGLTLPWVAWTVNRVVDAERLFALGAAAIITDRPDLWALA